ncbi:hypothetical protein [Aliiroseovarius sp.]|uniref:hypothetical protein n=1 Tax=Aliiroseovarius sp. TaxID=1872442 RepID=UPI00260426D2|nr:hypothetical protein [Aliiroseovarius sp.]
MKTFLKSTTIAMLIAAPATAPALAEGWSVYDLGEVPGDRENCMRRARNTIASYMFDHGGGETAVASWTTYGYDLRPGDQDAVIMCPVVNGNVVNAFLTVHGSTTEDERIFSADEIERIWNSMK